MFFFRWAYPLIPGPQKYFFKFFYHIFFPIPPFPRSGVVPIVIELYKANKINEAIWPCLICIRHKKSRFRNTLETFEKICFVGTVALFSRLKKFPWCSLKNTILEVHKELSKSYREGTAQKLKSMALPYKTKGLKKCQKIFFGVHKDLSYSYREGIDEKLKSMALPYKTKVLKKTLTKFYV